MRLKSYTIPFVLILLLFALPVILHQPQNPHYRYYEGYALPNPSLTPGAVNPKIVAYPDGRSVVKDGKQANICNPHFTTKPWRHETESEKHAICREYGITHKCPDHTYEIDHLVSLTIGGSNAAPNTWAQPWHQARIKDFDLEDKLRHIVCSGEWTLPEAQRCEAGNWVKCMQRVKKLEGRQ